MSQDRKKKQKATKVEGCFLQPCLLKNLSFLKFHFKNSTFSEDYKCHLNRWMSYIMIEMKAVILNTE